MHSPERSTDAIRNSFDTDDPSDFEAEGRSREFDSAAVVDRLALDRILGNLRGHLDTLIDHRPLDALALSMIVTAAENIRRAARTADAIRRENVRSARRRAAIERLESVDTLRRKVLKHPENALAEARANPESARCVVELWRCLGDSLTTAEGWNEEENALARALTGSAEERLRLTRERRRFDRALADDRQRPRRENAAKVDRAMSSHIDRLIENLERLVPGQRNLHQVVLESVQEKSVELMAMTGLNGRETAGHECGDGRSNREGRARWASTRSFVALRVRQWRSLGNRSIPHSKMEAPSAGFESFGIAEMRKADWARKSVSAAIADFQKTLALGKSIGLPDVICPKPADPVTRSAKARPRAEKPETNEGDEPVSRVQSFTDCDQLAHSKPARPANVRRKSTQGEAWPTSRPVRTSNTRTVDGTTISQVGQFRPPSVRPKPRRDRFGRFAKASGEMKSTTITPPRRDRLDRFSKASVEAIQADSAGRAVRRTGPGFRTIRPLHSPDSPLAPGLNHRDCRTVARPLRPSGDLWRTLLGVVPNVSGRGPDGLKPALSDNDPYQEEIGMEETTSADIAYGAGSIALADFDENVQNDDTKPPPEWASGLEADEDTGQAREGDLAGDDER